MSVWFWSDSPLLFPPLRSQLEPGPSLPLCYFPLTHFYKTPTPVTGFWVMESGRCCGTGGAPGQALGQLGLAGPPSLCQDNPWGAERL